MGNAPMATTPTPATPNRVLFQVFRLCRMDRSLSVSQRLDVPHRRLPEKSTVLATELADALVSDFVRRAGGIDPVHQHPLARCLQPQLLLVLQWTHRRE